MIPYLIDFADKTVIIVGGGKVAYRKIQDFVSEKANIKVIAPQIIEDIQNLPCECHIRNYQSKDLDGAFLVYAATDNRVLNEQIMKEANARHLLCASATTDHANLRSMKKVETQELILGVSTKHTYPAFAESLTGKLKVFDEPLMLLCRIRKFVLENNLVSKELRALFFKNLLLFSNDELEIIDFLMRQPSMLLLIFSGLLEKESWEFAKICQAMPISYRDEFYLTKIKTLLMMKVNWQIQPMVLSYGRIYERISESVMPYLTNEPLFTNDHLLSFIYKEYKKSRLFIIHPRGNSDLKKLLSSFGEVIEFQENLSLKSYDEIIPFILSEGYHYKHDIETLTINPNYLMPVLLKQEKYRELLANKIKQRFI
ncbi:MAG: bifunctional precorrin-2 dehydrogenase/sirohydrochlorin ferrochelatase [Beduini sp.]|uniref:precorrin-2 dehydrogenase/sirohydrochlorin ferrochelatase family protein n=1 Tax=Beduini sp. TaxID=1922300 RepID=UPI0011C74529